MTIDQKAPWCTLNLSLPVFQLAVTGVPLSLTLPVRLDIWWLMLRAHDFCDLCASLRNTFGLSLFLRLPGRGFLKALCGHGGMALVCGRSHTFPPSEGLSLWGLFYRGGCFFLLHGTVLCLFLTMPISKNTGPCWTLREKIFPICSVWLQNTQRSRSS